MSDDQCVYCLADVTVCERIAKNHPNQPIWKIYADQARYDAAQHTSDEHKRPKQYTHGTASGYQEHMDEGSEPCDPCRAGHAQRMREYRKRKRDG